jgi:hypothetical protein
MPQHGFSGPRHASALAYMAITCAFSALPSLPLLPGFTSSAFAAECGDDIGNLTKKRQMIIDQLNKLAKSSPRGQLDPTLSCPKLRDLATAEQELLVYLQKNKDWCMVPDEAITNITMSVGRTKTVASRACMIAEQMKKNQETGGLEGGQKLPTGPL